MFSNFLGLFNVNVPLFFTEIGSMEGVELFITVEEAYKSNFDRPRKLVVIDDKQVLLSYQNVDARSMSLLDTVKYVDNMKLSISRPVYNKNIIMSILETHRQYGFIADYTNIQYSIKNPKVRLDLKEALFTFLNGKSDFSECMTKAKACMPIRGKFVKIRNSIIEMIENKAFIDLHNAVKDSHILGVLEASNKHGVSTYDINYTRSFLNDKKTKIL